MVKNPSANAGDAGSISRSGRSPRGGNVNLLQYSCLENPLDRGAWSAKSMGSQRVRCNLATRHTCMHMNTGGFRKE